MLFDPKHSVPGAAPSTAVPVITGQTIAKAHWDVPVRAHLAADWVLGELQVKPSVKLAADTFGVCRALVHRAIREIQPNGNGAAPAVPKIDAIWNGLSDLEREDFAKRNMTSVWDAVDTATRVTA